MKIKNNKLICEFDLKNFCLLKEKDEYWLCYRVDLEYKDDIQCGMQILNIDDKKIIEELTKRLITFQY